MPVWTVVEELCHGCRVDEAFTVEDLVDSISADTSELRCGRVKAQILGLTWIRLTTRHLPVYASLFIAMLPPSFQHLAPP
ncbi:hypothetical protein DPX16_9611 [Anabarilius grahami]|uniref:Uncharacterized protein n=1 Tax=Anabarilius grahami TaxID=495550 RepID=A0A3N0Y9W3_ANAGA|nr:hypothetical protein DPX16_9611 [Anabarilius grahami]